MAKYIGANICKGSWALHSRTGWLRCSWTIRLTWAQTQPPPLSAVSPLAGAQPSSAFLLNECVEREPSTSQDTTAKHLVQAQVCYQPGMWCHPWEQG